MTATSRRPAPRRSSLAGSSPIDPPPAQPERTPQAVEPAHAMIEPEKSSTPTRKYPPKVSFYQSPEDTDRVRGAIVHTMASEGSRTLSQFCHRAVMAEVERLENKYNGGQPFPPLRAGEIPQGRPMGE